MRVLWLTFAALVASCGGGSQPVPPPPDPLAAEGLIDLSVAQATYGVEQAGVGGDGAGDGGVGGAAGDGSPLARATVVLTDSKGKTVTGLTDASGAYLLRFKASDFQAPFVVKVSDAGGNILASANEIVIPTGKAARVNINPLTDKVVSDVLPSGVNGTDKKFDGASLNTGALTQSKANLLASIQAALGVAGIADASKFDPVRSAYKHDGAGVDAVIESITHVREPASGVTQLRAKLAPLVTNADGSIVPVLITASTPLATTQVAISSNPTLTFGKITAWTGYLNACLKLAPGTPSADCNDDGIAKAVSPGYRQNSLDFDEDFRTLLSGADREGIQGSELGNPKILYIGRYPGSTTEDLAVVELTIRQPRTGPLAGNGASPIEYTKTLVFKRDDVTPGLKAGNWILHGNQRAYNWSIEPQYFTVQQKNPAAPANSSRTYAGLRLFFDTERFDPVTRSFVDAGVYAVRIKGPGLPGVGVVYAPTSSTTGGQMTILNRSGEIPSQGTRSSKPQSDFRIAGVVHPTGAALGTAWPGSAAGANLTHYGEAEFADFGKLQAFTLYTLEIFRNGAPTALVETSRILAPIEAPAVHVSRPLHDLTPSLAQIQPPQPATSSITARWVRDPSAARIEFAYFAYSSLFTSSANVPDAFSLAPSSTSVAISIAQGTAPEMTNAAGQSREIGIGGRAARARFQQSITWNQ